MDDETLKVVLRLVKKKSGQGRKRAGNMLFGQKSGRPGRNRAEILAGQKSGRPGRERADSGRIRADLEYLII